MRSSDWSSDVCSSELKLPPWEFGIAALFANLAKRGLLGLTPQPSDKVFDKRLIYPCTGSSIRVTTLATASKRVSWPNPPISCAPKGRPEGTKSVGKEIDGKCSKVHRAPKRGAPAVSRPASASPAAAGHTTAPQPRNRFTARPWPP